MTDDMSAAQLRADLDANCAVMGAYYCGECLQCRASAEIERLTGLIDPIVKAFTVPGNFPGYHDYLKRGLQKEWPALYASIQKLAEEYRG